MVAFLEIDPAQYPKLGDCVKRLKQLPYLVNSEGAQLFVANAKTNFRLREIYRKKPVSKEMNNMKEKIILQY